VRRFILGFIVGLFMLVTALGVVGVDSPLTSAGSDHFPYYKKSSAQV